MRLIMLVVFCSIVYVFTTMASKQEGELRVQDNPISPCLYNVSLCDRVTNMQLTEHHIRKRTAGEAAIRFGKFVFASGKQAFMWNRGRKAMKFVLKDAKLASTDMGVNEYTKVGGITRAMRDFMAARLHGVGSQVDPSDGTECYDGFAGEVWFLLKISDSKATLFVNKAANEVR